MKVDSQEPEGIDAPEDQAAPSEAVAEVQTDEPAADQPEQASPAAEEAASADQSEVPVRGIHFDTGLSGQRRAREEFRAINLR